MRPRAVLALTCLALVISGCFGGSGPTPPGQAGPAPPLYAPVCGLQLPDWPEPCNYRASHGPGSKTEIWAGVNPKDSKNVVLAAKDLNPEMSNHCVWNGIYVTKDGGQTWTDVHIGGKYADRKPGDPTYGYACNTDPDFSFAPDGTLYYAVEMYRYGPTRDVPDLSQGIITPGSQFLLATSHDGGLTWPSQVVAEIGDGNVAFHDYSRSCVSPKTGTFAYATGTFNVPGFIVGYAGGPANGAFVTVVASHDQGHTADRPIPITSRDHPGKLFIGAIACAPDGTFLVAMWHVDDASVWISTSTDDARSFSEPVRVFQIYPITKDSGWKLPNTEFRAFSTPELAFDRKSGTLYATWADKARGNADIVVARSLDQGKTWSAPVRVNDDNTTNAQWMSNIAVTDDGVVHVLYMDRRYDPGDRLIDLTYAFSTDGGKNWTNQRMTNASFDGDKGVHQDGFPFIGDYLGLSAAGQDVWGGFPDTVTGTAIVAAVHLHKNELT